MSKRNQWLLYGATGYSGSHIAEKAVAKGYKPVIAGRREKEVRAIADRLGLESRVVDVADTAALKSLVAQFPAVLHCAGPFRDTWQPMIEACISTGAHYLDITGEWAVYESLADMDARARKAGIMMMPGVGFDMVPSDCLSLRLKRMMPDAISLDIALSFEGTLTHGTIRSSPSGPLAMQVRRNHQLKSLDQPQSREYDFGPGRCGGRSETYAATFGDICIAWRTTGIPNVTAWLRPAKEFAALAALKSDADIDALPAGPSDEELRTIPTILIGEVRNAAGDAKAMRLVIPQIYAITFDLATAISQRVLEGTARAGFQTPANVFGEDYILEFEGCTMESWTPSVA